MRLGLDAGDFNTALAGANQSVNEASDKIQANWMKIGLGVTAMGTAIEAAFTVAIEEFVNAGVAIDVLSEKTGISTEAVSQWRYIAEQSGVSADSLTLAWRTMAKDITDVSGASSSAQKAFADLGLSLSDLQAMKPEDQFNAITTALAGVADKSVQSADAQAIFGRSGTDLLPILANGAAGIANLKDQATQLGIVYSGPAAAAALSFMDSQNNLKDSVKGVWDAIAQDLMPTIQPLIDDVTHAVEAVTHWADTHKALSSAIEIAVASIGVALIAVGTIITTMAAAAVAFEIGTVAAATFGVTLSAAIWPVTLVVAAIAALVAGTILVIDHWNEWRGVIEEVGSDIAVVLLVPIDLFIYALGGILDGIGKVASALHMSWGKSVEDAGKDLLDLNANIAAWGKAQDDSTKSVQSASENLKQENDYLSNNGRNLAVSAEQLKEAKDAQDAYAAAVKAVNDQVSKLNDTYQQSQTTGGKLGVTLDDLTNYLLKQGDTVDQIDAIYQQYGDDTTAILNSNVANWTDVFDSTSAGLSQMQANVDAFTAQEKQDAQDAANTQIQALSDSQTAFDNSISDQLTGIEQVKESTIAGINAELDAQLGQYNSQVASLQAQVKANQQAQTDKQNAEKLANLQSAVDQATTDKQKSDATKALTDFQTQLAFTAQQNQLQDQFTALQAQETAARADAQTKITAANDAYAAAKTSLDNQQTVFDANIASQKKGVTDLLDAKLAGYTEDQKQFDTMVQKDTASLQQFQQVYEQIMGGAGSFIANSLNGSVNSVVNNIISATAWASNSLSQMLATLAQANQQITEANYTLLTGPGAAPSTPASIAAAAAAASASALLAGAGASQAAIVNYGGGAYSGVAGWEQGYAEGGIVTKPTRALIGEGGENEAIIPLSNLKAMLGNIGDFLGTSTGPGTTINNTINMSGFSVRQDSDIDDIAEKIVGRLRLKSGLRT